MPKTMHISSLIFARLFATFLMGHDLQSQGHVGPCRPEAFCSFAGEMDLKESLWEERKAVGWRRSCRLEEDFWR
jgi:hypothetical protein